MGQPEISPALYRAGEGEPLVLVHGFTATWRCWLPQLAFLVPRFEVFAPTLPGHDGGPPEPPGLLRESFKGAGDRFEEALDEFGVETAHFAGNSMGGGLVLEMAKRGRARSVVAISPAGLWDPDDREESERIRRFFARAQRMAKLSLPTLPRVMASAAGRKLALRDVMTRGDQMPRDEAVQLVRSSVACTLVPEVFAALRDGTSFQTELDKISCPTLVAWGTKDRVLPPAKHSQRARSEIPGVEFRPWPGLGHTPMWDDPKLVADAIADWAAAAEAARAPASVAAA